MSTKSHLKCTYLIDKVHTLTTCSNSTFSFISEYMMVLFQKILSFGTWGNFKDKTPLLKKKTQRKPSPNSTQRQHAYKKTNTKSKILRSLFNCYWNLIGNTFKSCHSSHILLQYIKVRYSVGIPQFVVEIKIPHSRTGSGIFKTINN